MCRHSKSDVSGPSTEWSTALALGGAHKGLLLVFSLANLCQTELKASALAVWGQYCLMVVMSVRENGKWENREKMGKFTSCENPHTVVEGANVS